MTTQSDVTRPVDDGSRRAGSPADGADGGDDLRIGGRHLRCPFDTRSARLTELMTACPGFEPQQIRIAVQHDAEAPTVTACQHLQAVSARRGRFIPACHHPETWVVEAARTLIRRAALDPRGGSRCESPARRPADVALDLHASSAHLAVAVACGAARDEEPLLGEGHDDARGHGDGRGRQLSPAPAEVCGGRDGERQESPIPRQPTGTAISVPVGRQASGSLSFGG